MTFDEFYCLHYHLSELVKAERYLAKYAIESSILVDSMIKLNKQDKKKI